MCTALCSELQEVCDIAQSGFEHVLFPFERAAEYRAVRESTVAMPEVTRIAPSDEVKLWFSSLQMIVSISFFLSMVDART